MAHELHVEGDKVIEQDDKGHVLSTKDYTHVHSGYLATTHNPRVSQEAKETAEQLLRDLEAAHGDEPGGSKSHSPSHSKKVEKHETHEEEVHRHRQIGSYKAILHRDDRGEEAKQHAREMLEKLGVDPKEYENQA
ncbi:hypothetical protein JCM5353_004418 [Sporobolomyces roseus]